MVWYSLIIYNSDGSVKPRVFTKMIYVTIVKSRCECNLATCI